MYMYARTRSVNNDPLIERLCNKYAPRETERYKSILDLYMYIYQISGLVGSYFRIIFYKDITNWKVASNRTFNV